MNAMTQVHGLDTPQSVEAWVQNAQQKVYRPHCMNYGKLMKGDDPYGEIVPKYEHQRTLETPDFPDDLKPFCSPQALFPGWTGLGNSIKTPWHYGAAFAFRSVTSRTGQVYHIFCKIMPWLENSTYAASRVFTHMNLWCFEEQDFDILASVWIIYQLFFPTRGGLAENFAQPATEKLFELSEKESLRFAFDSGYEYWIAIAQLLVDRGSPTEILTELEQRRTGCPDQADCAAQQEWAKEVFLVQSLAAVFGAIDKYRVQADKVNFCIGFSKSALPDGEPVKHYRYSTETP